MLAHTTAIDFCLGARVERAEQGQAKPLFELVVRFDETTGGIEEGGEAAAVVQRAGVQNYPIFGASFLEVGAELGGVESVRHNGEAIAWVFGVLDPKCRRHAGGDQDDFVGR